MSAVLIESITLTECGVTIFRCDLCKKTTLLANDAAPGPVMTFNLCLDVIEHNFTVSVKTNPLKKLVSFLRRLTG